jgi:hypothetical protein
MATIIGVVLLFAGQFGTIAAVITYFHAELDLFEKRPDLAGLQDLLGHRRRREIDRAYKNEFPRGRKMLVSLFLFLGAMASLFSGLWVLTAFQ